MGAAQCRARVARPNPSCRIGGVLAFGYAGPAHAKHLSILNLLFVAGGPKEDGGDPEPPPSSIILGACYGVSDLRDRGRRDQSTDL
jgi:hypothetical protein